MRSHSSLGPSIPVTWPGLISCIPPKVSPLSCADLLGFSLADPWATGYSHHAASECVVRSQAQVSHREAEPRDD